MRSGTSNLISVLLRAVVILSSNHVLIGCCVVVAKRNFEFHFGLLRAVVILSSNLVLVGCCVIVAKWNFESHFGFITCCRNLEFESSGGSDCCYFVVASPSFS